MFDVFQFLAVLEAGAPPTVPNGTINCATMTLLALFFIVFKKG